ncbi:MAG: hypothetical protein IT290_09590 [Deltaproteobacteria bacterium]|nr:hypothetical protein [Deltaproteobacteria bacterium]
MPGPEQSPRQSQQPAERTWSETVSCNLSGIGISYPSCSQYDQVIKDPLNQLVALASKDPARQDATYQNISPEIRGELTRASLARIIVQAPSEPDRVSESEASLHRTANANASFLFERDRLASLDPSAVKTAAAIALEKRPDLASQYYGNIRDAGADSPELRQNAVAHQVKELSRGRPEFRDHNAADVVSWGAAHIEQARLFSSSQELRGALTTAARSADPNVSQTVTENLHVYAQAGVVSPVEAQRLVSDKLSAGIPTAIKDLKLDALSRSYGEDARPLYQAVAAAAPVDYYEQFRIAQRGGNSREFIDALRAPNAAGQEASAALGAYADFMERTLKAPLEKRPESDQVRKDPEFRRIASMMQNVSSAEIVAVK